MISTIKNHLSLNRANNENKTKSIPLKKMRFLLFRNYKIYAKEELKSKDKFFVAEEGLFLIETKDPQSKKMVQYLESIGANGAVVEKEIPAKKTFFSKKSDFLIRPLVVAKKVDKGGFPLEEFRNSELNVKLKEKRELNSFFSFFSNLLYGFMALAIIFAIFVSSLVGSFGLTTAFSIIFALITLIFIVYKKSLSKFKILK